MATLNLRARLWLTRSTELFDEMYAKLEAFLDNLAAARLDRLPARLHHLIEGLPESKKLLLPSAWRRLWEVEVIRDGVRRLLADEDPKIVKARMPAPGLPYAEFRAEQRLVISSSHDAILGLAQKRIVASQWVAAEKYLEGDTIHKPEVEENLFLSARRRGRQIGLPSATAEDIARLLLAKAREVQEQTLNKIAVKLSRLYGEILDATSPQTSTGEMDIAIPSLVVRTGDQPLAREDEVIKEFRLTGLNENYSRERESFLSWFGSPHHYAVKGLIIGSRDSDLFLQAFFNKERCKVLASFTPNGSMHIGHGALINLLTYFQRLGADVVISFNDLELLQRDISAHVKGSEQDTLMQAVMRSRARARDVMYDFLLQFAAMGLDLDRVDAYSHLSRPEVLELAFELGGKIKVNVLNSALGLRMDDSATNTFLPLVYVADILHPQMAKYGGPCRTWSLSGLERDVYVRMARNIAGQFDFQKPSALYLRMVRALATYEDPRSGAAVDVMTGSNPQGAILYEDEIEVVRRKIRHAFTGGRKTREEQRLVGGNPDPRICSVSSLPCLSRLY
jgi:tryptophanyl-tRNA synthetase